MATVPSICNVEAERIDQLHRPIDGVAMQYKVIRDFQTYIESHTKRKMKTPSERRMTEEKSSR